MYIQILKYNKYIVHFFSKTFGAENNPVRSSISDQCYFYAKYDKNASTRACFSIFLGEQITHSRVCTYNQYFLEYIMVLF